VNVAQPGGEVVALDSADFGSISITKAVSVFAAPEAYAGVTPTTGNGVVINAGKSDTVILRGLTISNAGGASGGIAFEAGQTVHIEDCILNGFSSGSPSNPLAAILFLAPGNLEIKDSIIRGNDTGIILLTQIGTAAVTLDRVRIEGGMTGLEALQGSKVTVRNSVVSGANSGLLALSGSTAPVDLNIESSVVANNSYGIFAEPFSSGVVTIRVSNSTVTGNGYGIWNAGAVVLSRGNNTVEGNGLNTVGVIGAYSAK